MAAVITGCWSSVPLRGENSTNRRIPSPGPQESSLEPLQGTAWTIPWDKSLERREVQEYLLIFVEPQPTGLEIIPIIIPMVERSNQGGKRPAWLNKEFLIKLRLKKETHEVEVMSSYAEVYGHCLST